LRRRRRRSNRRPRDTFVNTVTHEAHGHPSEYLWEALEDEFDSFRLEYVDQCGCGGCVTRAHVGEDR